MHTPTELPSRPTASWTDQTVRAPRARGHRGVRRPAWRTRTAALTLSGVSLLAAIAVVTVNPAGTTDQGRSQGAAGTRPAGGVPAAPDTGPAATGPASPLPTSSGGPSADPSTAQPTGPSVAPTAAPSPTAIGPTSRPATAAPKASASATTTTLVTATTARPTAAPGGGPVGPDPKVPGPRTDSRSNQDAEALSLQLLNAERATVGLPPLALRADLTDYARRWAQHMRTSGFGHSAGSDTQYLVTGSRTWIGENIVWWSDPAMTAQEAAERFQSMWRHSPGHYKAQTSTSFTEVGVGVYHDESGWWGVHNFSDAH
ncbi:CAP domain-containing protein [Kitasatospora sp. NPDC004240]